MAYAARFRAIPLEKGIGYFYWSIRHYIVPRLA